MIFSEIYGLYFRTMEKLIAEASSGTLDRESFCRIVRETAFSESELFIESAIKSGEWKKRFGVKSAQQLPKEPDELSAETKMSIWLWGISMCAIGAVIGVVIAKLQL